MKNVKLTDVAEAAGVSLSAVSRYVNDNGYVSADKKRAIRNAINELGYSPSKQKNKRSNIIGMISFDGEINTYYYKVWKSFVRAARRKKKGLLLLTSEQIGNSNLPELLDEMMTYNVDGIIIAGFGDDELSEENQERIDSLPVPVLLYERDAKCKGISSVSFDQRRGVSDAVEYLYAMGHRRIVYMGQIPNSEVDAERYISFMEASQKKNLPVTEDMIGFVQEYNAENGRSCMHKLMAKNPDITALVIVSDILAAGAMQAAYENGKSIPGDYSIVGFDNTYSEFSAPKMSTIGFPMDEAADKVIEILCDAYGQDNAPIEKEVFRLLLIRRDSVRRISPQQ